MSSEEDSSDDDVSKNSDVDVVGISEQVDGIGANLYQDESADSENEFTETTRDPHWTANMEEEEADSSDINEVNERESQDKTSQRDVRYVFVYMTVYCHSQNNLDGSGLISPLAILFIHIVQYIYDFSQFEISF